MDQCNGCKYFVPQGELPIGRCYRFPRNRIVIKQVVPTEMPDGPPKLVEQEVESCNYPIQQPTDWCGEFAPAMMVQRRLDA